MRYSTWQGRANRPGRAATAVVAALVAAMIGLAGSGPSAAAIDPSQQFMTSALGTANTPGEAVALTFGASGVTGLYTVSTATDGGEAVGGAGAFPGPNVTTYLEPDPPPESTTVGQNAFSTSTLIGTVVLSAPIGGLILHIAGLDGSQLTVSGTSTTGDPITLVPLVKNNEMEIAGNTLNTTAATFVNQGCETDTGANPNGACGSIALTATTGLIQSFTLINRGTAAAAGGDVWRWTLSFPRRAARAAVVASSTNWSLANGQPETSTIDFTYGARPLAPLMGDWDGDDTKTVGTFEQGIFRLNNQNDSSPPELAGPFGDPRGYPVAGDFDGNGIDDIAVYRAGGWEIGYLGVGSPNPISFTLSAPFGTGTWPNTIPVAGDWDGDGLDGIGTYDYATGTWVLKNTAGPGGPDIGPFVLWGGSGSYPVVGDFGAIGIDTPGYRVGTTWTARTAAVTSGATITFTFGAANSIPFTW